MRRMADLRPVFSLTILAAAVTLIVSAGNALRGSGSAGDDEDTEVQPGLLAIYGQRLTSGYENQATISLRRDEPLDSRPNVERPPHDSDLFICRYETKPAFLLSRNETPDSRLETDRWEADWSGVIRIPRSGAYRFSMVHSGPTSIKIGSRVVRIEEQSSDTPTAGDAIELPSGLSRIRIRFTSSEAAPKLKLYWESRDFPRESIPPYALGHLKESSSNDTIGRAVERDSKFVRGRLAVEDQSCVACHWARSAVTISEVLMSRRGPRLTNAGQRLKAAWIYHWLGDPQALRPQAVMPRLFADDRAGEIERMAVAMYLASQGATLKEATESIDANVATQGEQFFNRIGCIVCHEAHGAEPSRATLSSLGQKTTLAALTDYLKDPLAIDPAGRMPGFNLNAGEAKSIAAYLIGRDNKPVAQKASSAHGLRPEAAATKELELPKLPPIDELRDALLDGGELTAKESLILSDEKVRQRLVSFGRRVIQQKNCAACHEFVPAGERAPLAAMHAQHDFREIAFRPSGGCLAEPKDQYDGKVPQFGKSFDRSAAVEFLKVAATAPGTAAPGEEARLTLERFNCLGCHERDGHGGLAPDVIKRLAENQTPEAADLVRPPQLTGVTGKLLAGYINAVLLDGRRSRPWMTLRMPQFSKEAIANLPAGLAALDAEPLHSLPDASPIPPPTEDAVLSDAGRTLVGSKGFGCTKCHDMLGVPSRGTRGPDLAQMTGRVNFAWYDRWMADPQRIQPGTRMPTVFLNGKSPYQDILGGDPVKQRLAIWRYLANCKNLPPPDGLEERVASDAANGVERYQCLRTFLPDVTPRSMAIRFANGVHLAYDLQACRLAYAWSGDFLDLSPVWEGRGGNPAGIKGHVFWHSPAGFPWDVTPSSGAVPDFTGRGTDTSLGAALPYDFKLHPTRLDFRGYHLDEAGPTFRYELQLDGGRKASFTEQVVSLHTPMADGALRTATVAAPAGQTIWLNVATSEQPPEWTTTDGNSRKLDQPDKSAPGDAVLRCTTDGKPVVVHLRTVPPGAAWLASKQKDKWHLVLRFNSASDEKPARIDLVTLSPTNSSEVQRVMLDEAHPQSP